MFIVGLLSWWYSAGSMRRAGFVKERLLSTVDYFSIGLLLKTLFTPFRQISAGKVQGPIGVKWRAFVDRLVSRVIGAVVRTIMIFIGMVTIILFSLFGALTMLVWFLIPLFPMAGAVAAIIGWTPSWT